MAVDRQLTRSRQLKKQFDAAHQQGMAALKQRDLPMLGKAIEEESRILGEQRTLLTSTWAHSNAADQGGGDRRSANREKTVSAPDRESKAATAAGRAVDDSGIEEVHCCALRGTTTCPPTAARAHGHGLGRGSRFAPGPA